MAISSTQSSNSRKQTTNYLLEFMPALWNPMIAHDVLPSLVLYLEQMNNFAAISSLLLDGIYHSRGICSYTGSTTPFESFDAKVSILQ